LLGAPSPVAAAIDRQVRTILLPPTRTLSIDITIGAVHIEGSTRADAEIEIVRRTPTEAGMARIPVAFAETDTDVRVSALQAEDGADPAYRSEITVRVPHGAQLPSVHLLEGRVTLRGLHGTIGADVRRGSITASDISGTVRLESGIGDITIERGRLSPAGLLRLRTFNGNIRLTLVERPIDARVMALALNGTIASDIPLAMKSTWGPRWGEATLGRGEPVISLDVVNGRIEIRAPGK
jgi:DUF4097 and DUF4098 domain-containing protein YvlB